MDTNILRYYLRLQLIIFRLTQNILVEDSKLCVQTFEDVTQNIHTF